MSGSHSGDCSGLQIRRFTPSGVRVPHPTPTNVREIDNESIAQQHRSMHNCFYLKSWAGRRIGCRHSTHNQETKSTVGSNPTDGANYKDNARVMKWYT